MQAVPITDIVKNISSADIVTDPIIGTSLETSIALNSYSSGGSRISEREVPTQIHNQALPDSCPAIFCNTCSN